MAIGTVCASTFTTQTGIKLGYSAQAGTPYFTGSIDQVHIYNCALNARAVLDTLYRQEVGLIAYLPCDENSGLFAQSVVGAGIYGTLTGNSTWASGKYGSGIAFNSGGVITPAACRSSRRCACRIPTIRWPAGSTPQRNGRLLRAHRFSSYNNIWEDNILALSNGNLTATIAGDNGLSTVNVYNDGNWHQVVSTIGGETGAWKLYVDGVLQATGTLSTRQDTANRLGLVVGPDTDICQVTMDEVRVYGRALTASEIAALYTDAAPSVSVSEPTDNSTILAGSTLTLQAQAADAGNDIRSVTFYANGELIGQAVGTSSPYTTSWVNVPAGSYLLTARVADLLGTVTTSAAVSLTVVNAAVPTANLSCWLRADAGVTMNGSNYVSTWADQSGNGNNATQSTPSQQPLWESSVLNGYPILHFDGVQSVLQMTNDGVLDNPFTVFAVYTKEAAGSMSLLAEYPNDLYSMSISGRTDTTLAIILSGWGDFTVDVPAYSAPSFVVDSFVNSSSSAAIWRNGTQLGTFGFGLQGTQSSGPLMIGYSPGDYWLDGDLAEMIIYNTALSDTNRQAVEQYLLAKYNLQSTVSQPLFAAAPGAYNSAQTVTISSTSGATIRYTTDGTIPTESVGTVYSSAVVIAQTTTLQAIAYLIGMNDSTVTSGVYTINNAALPMTNLSFWLRADAGVTHDSSNRVSSWADQSGNGHTATQTTQSQQPLLVNSVLNGYPILRFDGVQSVLQMTNYGVLDNPFTVFAVYTKDAAGSMSLFAETPNEWGGITIAGCTDTTLSIILGGWGSFTVNVPAYNGPSFVVDSFMNSSSSAAIWRNGTQLGTFGFGLQGTETSGPLMIGYCPGGPYWLDGDLAELIGYNTALSGSERQAVEDYLLSKYNIAIPVSAASFTPAAGTYGFTQQVSLSSLTNGATIRYTTDGSTPSETAGTVYCGPVSIAANTTLQAIAYRSGQPDSPVSSALYAIQCAAPAFTPAALSYSAPVAVTITSPTPGATIRYTTDGSTPSETNGTVYSSAFTLPASCTLQAMAYHTGMTDSGITAGVYLFQCAAPAFTPAPGSYSSAQIVTITSATSGATIRYTTDGTTPSETVGTVYSTPVNISNNCTLKAIAYETGMTDSPVTSALYKIAGAGSWYLDTTTQGTWWSSGGGDVYGGNGYVLCGWNADTTDVVSLTGSYVQSVTPSNQSNYCWATNQTDPRAAINPATGTRNAGCWYTSAQSTFDVLVTLNNPNDGLLHRMAVYCLDWNELARTQTIDLQNPSTGLSELTGGPVCTVELREWNLGHLLFRRQCEPAFHQYEPV